MGLVPNFISFEHGTVHRPIMKTAATEHAVGTRTCECRAIRGELSDVPRESVLAPLPYVARHVVKAELIRSLQRHRLRVIAVLAVVPRDGVDILTTTESKAVTPERASTSGVL